MKKVLIFVCALFAVTAGAAQEEALLDVQNAFVHEVGDTTATVAYQEQVKSRAEDLIRLDQTKFTASQFFLLVDRNHEEQKAFLAFYDIASGSVAIIGTDKVSTGNPKRRGHFETPIGIFENSPTNMSYRALGTKNKVGWRGLGAKGSRVWDLGWQRTVKGKGEPMDIRLMVHATDPDQGEQRLGTIQSMGCIRVSSRLNRFLDQRGVLDRSYEENAKAKYVLLASRHPISFAGKFIVIIDSQ